MKSKLLLVLLAGMMSTTTAFADNSHCSNTIKYGADGTSGIELEFGDGTADITTCITKKSGLKIVLNMGSGATGGTSGTNQVLNNATNMLANYHNLYGLDLGGNLKMSLVAHYQGAPALIDSPGNINKPLVEALLTQGVHIYMCQTTMRAKGWKTSQLIKGVEEVPAGVHALVDFASTGWTVITP
jgi:intracellular sulfur oxidation DsrE/DsrF family protein